MEATIYNQPIEQVIKEFKDNSFDLVFTTAVLQHIHPKSEFVFQEIARITRHTLITIEDERVRTWRAFPRKYKKIFESLGFKQLEEINCSKIEEEMKTYYARVFAKKNENL